MTFLTGPSDRDDGEGGPVRVLLTGAAGFIGGTVADQLGDRGHDVVGVDALLPSAHLPETSTPAGVVPVDVRDEDALTPLMDGVDVVCHQAAMVGLGVDVHDAPAYCSVNVVGTASVLSAMARAGVGAFVQASSMVVYGDGGYRCAEHGDVRPARRTRADLDAGRFDPPCPHCAAPLHWVTVREDAPLAPQNTYATTKLAQEHLAQSWATATGGRAVSLRYHNVYGPRMPQDTPYAGVASIFRSALAAGESPRVFEDGGQMRDFVHVADIAATVVAAVERHATAVAEGGHLPLNVASGEPRTVLEMATELSRAMDGPEPVVVGGGRPGDVRHIVADPGAARERLGAVPRTDFAAGMAEFASAPMRRTR